VSELVEYLLQSLGQIQCGKVPVFVLKLGLF